MVKGILITEDDTINLNNINITDTKFIIIRAGYTSYGKNKEKYKDSKFDEYYSNALKKTHNVLIYYESCATSVSEAREEANYFLKLINDKIINYPLCVLINDDHNTVIYSKISQKELTKDELTCVINEFCKVIIENGYDIFILSSSTWFKNLFDIEKLNSKTVSMEIDDSSMYRYININNHMDDKIQIVLNEKCAFNRVYDTIKIAKKLILKKLKKVFKSKK